MKQLRQIIRIDNDKCNGCGKCVNACHEGALRIVDGKAVLVADHFCDGLGACIGDCPMDALTFETREADAFDEAAVQQHLATPVEPPKLPCGCPGTMARKINHQPPAAKQEAAPSAQQASRLDNWPVQLQLIPASAPYLKDAELVLAAHCAAFADANFHSNFLGPNKVLAIACPKLDDAQKHIDKLAQIIAANQLFGITIARMEVPCCGGLEQIVRQAVAQSGANVNVRVKTITIG